MLRDLVELREFSVGGQTFLGRDGVKIDDSSTDGRTGECITWIGMPPFGRLRSGKSKGVGLREKPSALGGCTSGKAGTGGG
jgi:hypothetical protein